MSAAKGSGAAAAGRTQRERAAGSGARRDGRSTRWDPHRRERRLQIIGAAVRAVELHGPDASTAQIADLAGVPRTHVYRHFDGKQSLDLAVSAHVARQIGARIRAGLSRGATARAVIGSAVDEHLGWVGAHPNLYRFLIRHAYAATSEGPAPVDAKAAFAAELTTLLQAYLALLGVDPAPAERAVVGVVGLVDATAAWWIDRSEPSRAQLTAELTEQAWLIIERSGRALGLTLDPDAPLPSLDARAD